MIRIIDNKKIDLTESEFQLYQEICKAYDTTTFQGKDLFKGLFETNDDGLIIFLKPSNKPYASMEVFLFLISIMVHQHLRQSTQQFDSLMDDARRVLTEAREVLSEMKAQKSE
jgi:hypothetical protein